MALLDKTGNYLEGVRVSTGNGFFSLPPRSLVSNPSALAARTARSEYCVVADGQDGTVGQTDIADPKLLFRWTRSDPGVSRFDYDSFGRRWLPSPGGPPDVVGTIEEGAELSLFVPADSPTAPYSVYVGHPARIAEFSLAVVPDSDSFSPPSSVPQGTIEVSAADGVLNLGSADVASLSGQVLLATRQGFFDRTKSTGSVGSLPASPSVPYHLFLNPRPAPGQRPRVRIGYGRHLEPSMVSTESDLGSPAPGTFEWTADTGKLRFSEADVSALPGREVLYDGVFLGQFSLARTMEGSPAFHPSPSFTIPSAVGLEDPRRFVIFGELTTAAVPRFFLEVVLVTSQTIQSVGAPSSGTALLNTDTGEVFLSLSDLLNLVGRTMGYVDTVAAVEGGVSFQAFRSGVNSRGKPLVPDFNVTYSVSKQVIQDGLSGSPVAMLPVVPTVDGDLVFRVESGPSSTGRFRSGLVDGTDPSKEGFGYLLNLDQKQLRFCRRTREDLTLQRPSPVLKLGGAAVSPLGLEVSRNGERIEPGVDFDFDAGTGLLEFVSPVGENDPSTATRVAMVATLPDLVDTGNLAVTQDHVGRALLVRSGDNQGYYVVTEVLGSHQVRVDKALGAAGAMVADFVPAGEDLVDRFWTPFLPPYKKFSLSRGPSTAGPFTEVPNTKFKVLRSTGQVNLTDPALPGEVFQATYVQLELQDDGVTTVPRNRVERALFKVRQEQGSVTPGSSLVSINPDSMTVRTIRPMNVAVNGVTQDAGTFSFIPPGTVRLAAPVMAGDSVVVDYWVEEATGGNANFNLVNVPLDVDTPEVVAGESSAEYNGDQTSRLEPGSAILIGQTDVVVIATSSYDPVRGVTSVTFESDPPKSSEGADLMSTGPVGGSFRVAEATQAAAVPKDTNKLVLKGRRERDYRAGTIVTLDGDPYVVTGSKADPDPDPQPSLVVVANPLLSIVQYSTTVSLATTARRNYVMPNITRTVRPVVLPGGSFSTARQATLRYPFTLVRMGPRRKVLVAGADYEVSEGGSVVLESPAEYGDSLHALYVAREPQPAGTELSVNYAFAVAPDGANGMLGQRLLASYALHAPDSFFFRVETFQTLLPEFTDALQSSGSSGSSGPNTSSSTSPSSKEFGSPGLFFSEQNAANVDDIGIRLLKYFNDVVNWYEDILANLDGRVVGGTSGRFRFDGLLGNPDRDSYGEVTNDVDDRIRRKDQIRLTGFYSFETVPVYSSMAEPNRLSRLFPILKTATIGINDKLTFEDFGEVIGSVDAEKITFTTPFTTAKASARVTAASGATLTLDSNGDFERLLPPFESGQKVHVHAQDGTEVAVATIQSVGSGGGAEMVLSSPVEIVRGSVLVDQKVPNDPTFKSYVPNRDLILDLDSGEVKNCTLPPPLDAIQNLPTGNEVLDVTVIYSNQEVAPRRIPVLDGSTMTDDGRVSQPQLEYPSELQLLEDESSLLSQLGQGMVQSDLVTVGGSGLPVGPGDVVRSTGGPNAGLERTVLTVVSPSVFTVTQPWLSEDLDPADMMVVPTSGTTVESALSALSGVLVNSVQNPASPPALIGSVNSEMRAAISILESLGPEIASGPGAVSGAVLTDMSRDFAALGVDETCLVWVSDGPNYGLYRVAEAAVGSLTVSVEAPFLPFPSPGAVQYRVIRPEAFMGPTHGEFLTEFLRETEAFARETEAWASSLGGSGTVARSAAIAARQARVQYFVQRVQDVLIGAEKFYELRYLWIQQRADRKNGSLSRKRNAERTRLEDEEKLVGDQRKLLVARALQGLA
jgi:hypothetical protein